MKYHFSLSIVRIFRVGGYGKGDTYYEGAVLVLLICIVLSPMTYVKYPSEITHFVEAEGLGVQVTAHVVAVASYPNQQIEAISSQEKRVTCPIFETSLCSLFKPPGSKSVVVDTAGMRSGKRSTAASSAL